MNPFRTRTELDLESTVGSLAAHVGELEADNAALKRQLEEAWAAADTARAQRDRAMEDCSRLFAHGSEALDQRDRARATAVALEQDGAMAHKALMILAEAVLNEVNPNAAVYSKALAVKQIGGTA